MPFMIIAAIGLAVGAALGLFEVGAGVKKRQEEIGKGIAESITWLTVIGGICIVLALVLFFVTRSKATIGPKGAIAAVQGGGAPLMSGGGVPSAGGVGVGR